MTTRPHDDDDDVLPPADDAGLQPPDDDAIDDATDTEDMPRAWLRHHMASGEYDVVSAASQRVIVPPRPTRDAAERVALIMGFSPYRYAITIPDEAYMAAHRLTGEGVAADAVWAADGTAKWRT